MKQLLFVYLLLGCVCTAVAQTGKLSGWVKDAGNNTPMELATVSILNKDSSLFGYQLTDNNGNFNFTKLPLRKPMLLTVTYSGYTTFNTAFQLATDKADTLQILMSVNTKDTFVVSAVSPVKMNGDTLEINPAAFKMREDAVVEEMLNQVSGITIWSDGTITINGKKVQSLLVDGKPFMGAKDARVATQNLPKSSIDKIQLYQEYDRSNIGQTGQQQDSLLTMNIKLKEGSKKGYFGKAGGGYGTTDRFESDLSLQTYTKQTSLGIGGGFNNVNKPLGNIQDMFQQNTYRNFNPNLYNVGRFGTSGVNKSHSIGAAFNHSFLADANSRQNNRVALNYSTAGTNSYLTDLSLQNRTTIDNPQFIREEGVQRSVSKRNDLNANYTKTNSYNDNFSLNGFLSTNQEDGNSLRLTDVRDSLNRLQSSNNVTTVFNRNSDNKNFNGHYAKSVSDDPLKGFNLNFSGREGNNSSERTVLSRFESFTDPSKSTNFNRRYNNNDHTVGMNANLDYSGFKRLILGRYNLFGINLNFNQALNYSKATDNAVVSDYDSVSKQYVSNAKISNRNERTIFEYAPTLTLGKSSFKWFGTYYRNLNFQLRLTDDIKTDKNRSASFAVRNIDRSFQFFTQQATASYQLNNQQRYQYSVSANYTKSYDYPSVDQLFTIVDDINVYDTRIGNPNLKNRKNHSFNTNINFNTQNQKSPYSINGSASGNYVVSVNPVTDSVINDPSGKRLYYYVNADQSNTFNVNYNFNISRRFSKNMLQLMYNGQFRTGMVPNYIDNVYNTSKTNNLSNQFTLQYTLGSMLVLTATRSFQRSQSRQSASGLNSFKNANNTTRLGMVVNYPRDFSLSSTFDQIDNSNLNRPTLLWNAFASYRIMKGQGELKASAMDILKQYRNISNTVNSYGTTTRVTNGLQQFYMLTFSYYPRKFGKTQLKGRRR